MMRCPQCGAKLSFLDMTWKERLFWSCLVTIALNQSANFYEWIYCWLHNC